MGTQRSVQVPVYQFPGLIAQIDAANLQTDIVQSLFRVFLNFSCQSAFPGVSSAYQLTEYSLLISN